MDLTRTVRYRQFDLNSIRHDTETRDMVGCEITRVAYHGVQGVAYDEKKAMADGYDAGDVWLAKRIIQMSGNLYGRTRAEFFDILMDFMVALTPTAAYDENPSNKGYLPLDFYIPSGLTETVPPPSGGVPPAGWNSKPWAPDGSKPPETGPYPDGLRHVMLLARPSSQPAVEFGSDTHGGPDDHALSIPWAAVLEARLPHLLNFQWTEQSMAGMNGGSGYTTNRGNRPASFELRLVVPPNFNGTSTAGKIRIVGLGTVMGISIPAKNAQQIIRYDSYHKTLGVDGALRMDLLTFDVGASHGRILPGYHSYSWTRTGVKNLSSGSYFRFRDTWA